MTGTTKMRVTKPNDGFIVILVSRTILIHIGVVFAIEFIGDRIRIRA